MTINKKFVPIGLKNNPNKNLTAVKFITIHNTGNRAATATAKMHSDYQYNGSGGAATSWHYSVDDKEIWQSFEDTRACWHAGDGSGAGNTQSIGIEICVNSKSGFYDACRNAAWLVSELLHRHNLTLENVKQHFDWSKKNCPAELRSGEWGVSWNDFIDMAGQYFHQNVTSNKTPIMGKSECTAEQLNIYAKSKNPNAPEYGAIFIEEGDIEGVRGDLAFCQSLHETGFFKFGGDVSASQNNFAGIGAVGGGAKGASFTTARDGIRAQIQHLKVYASTEPLKQLCADPRFSLVTRGIAPNWEDLNGKWAPPGNGYGEGIVKLWGMAKAVKVPDAPPTVELSAEEAIAVLVKHGVINSPEYWLAAVSNVKYLDALIINMVKKLSE
jgi:hypothetical protein